MPELLPASIAELMTDVELAAPLNPALRGIISSGVAFDSRRVKPGSLFMAFAGANVDGRSFARAAVDLGAIAVLSELPPLEGLADVWIQVKAARKALAIIARRLFDDPSSKRIAVFGITGTNGKTTSTYLIASILESAGYNTGLFGTIEYRIGGRKLPSINTTPESVELYEHFAELLEASQKPAAVAMEVSSHALALGRVWGIHFAGVVWTNLTRDHLDFHGDMAAYFQAKTELFSGQGAPAPGVAAINFDDEYGRRIETNADTRVWSYALREDSPASTIRARNIRGGFNGVTFDLESPLGVHEFHSKMLGDVNVSNILGAAGVTLAHGIAVDKVQEGIANCASVPGRFERVDEGQNFLVIVDYAHTDDAIRNVVRVARTLKPNRVITLFGCGGDRDRAKRPLMGAAAASSSDYVILTSDNPRTEDPIAIMNDALVGLRRFDTPHTVEPDREKAIRKAISMAHAGDVVLILGKGHEDYQVVGKTKHPFDDREVARRALNR